MATYIIHIDERTKEGKSLVNTLIKKGVIQSQGLGSIPEVKDDELLKAMARGLSSSQHKMSSKVFLEKYA